MALWLVEAAAHLGVVLWYWFWAPLPLTLLMGLLVAVFVACVTTYYMNTKTQNYVTWPTNWLFLHRGSLYCVNTYLHRPPHSPAVALTWSSIHTLLPPWTAEGETCAPCEPESQIQNHSWSTNTTKHTQASLQVHVCAKNLKCITIYNPSQDYQLLVLQEGKIRHVQVF